MEIVQKKTLDNEDATALEREFIEGEEARSATVYSEVTHSGDRRFNNEVLKALVVLMCDMAHITTLKSQEVGRLELAICRCQLMVAFTEIHNNG